MIQVIEKYGGYEGSDYENGNVDSNKVAAAIDSAGNANVDDEANWVKMHFCFVMKS